MPKLNTSPEIVERANQSNRLLQDPTFIKLFEHVRQSLLQKLEEAPISDRDLHHELTLSLQLLKRLKNQLHSWSTDGTVEIKAAEQRRSLLERVNPFFKI